MFSAIVAIDENYGIAKNGKIPWHCPEDMIHFKNTTTDGIVVMGRKTWDSLPDKSRPLPNRINVIISKSMKPTGSAVFLNEPMVFGDVFDCVRHLSDKKYKSKKLFVIGGASIYKQFFDACLVHQVLITHIKGNYECNQFFLSPDLYFSQENKIFGTSACTYYTINHEENQFLHLMNNILKFGAHREDRTGVGTRSIFSSELRFDLSQNRIPMMTTRPLSLRYIFEELMWILRGQTDNKVLNDKKIHIWDNNTSREFLDEQQLHDLPKGDIGASYGFQMRHFGAKYENCKADYGEKGFDQLQYVIDLLKNNPTSRRIVINLWNPTDLSKMALPPCLYGFQFYVASGRLNCKLIQRSSDVCLAGSHNCVAGALFVRMLCVIVGLKPGELIWSPGDVHIYDNQVEAVREQISRYAMPFPTLNIKKLTTDIFDFEYGDLELINYRPQKKISFAMNA